MVAAYLLLNGDPLISAGVPPVAVSGAAPTAGMVIAATSGTAASWADVGAGTITLSGDVTGAGNANTVVKIDGASVPAAGSLTTGNVLQVSGASALSYAPVNLAGGANFVTGSLPAGNQANQTMGGDATGTTGSNTVVSVTGTGTNGYAVSGGTNVNITATETVVASSSTAPVKSSAGTATTTDGTTWVNIATWTPAASSVEDVFLTLVARSTTNDGYYYRSDVFFTISRTGSSAPVFNPVTPAVSNVRSSNLSASVQVILSTNLVEVQVQGIASNTVHWSCIQQNSIIT